MSLDQQLAAGRARQEIADLRGRLRTAQRTFEAERSAALDHKDERLTAAGLSDKRAELEAAARTRLEAEVSQVSARIDAAAAVVRSFAQESRPRPQADQARQTRLWDRARQLLESGRSPAALVKETQDLETLAVLREELPSYVRSQVRPGIDGSEPDLTVLLRTVDQRLGVLAEGEAGIAVRWGNELDVQVAEVAPMLRHATHQAAGIDADGDGLAAALEARYAAQEAASTIPDPADAAA